MRNTEIIIVGQGLAGSLLAAELVKAGTEFLVLDYPEPSAASMVAGGAFIPLVFRTLKKPEMIDAYLAAIGPAYKHIEQLTQTTLLHNIPSLKLFRQDSLDAWREAKLTESGEFIRRIDDNIILEGVRSGYCGAVIEPSGYVDTALLVNSMRSWLEDQGLLIREKVDYSTIGFLGDKVEIKGRFSSPVIVFCEGAKALNNPWFNRAGFSLNKGEILEIYSRELSENFVIRADVFLLPLGNHYFRVGATYDVKNPDGKPTPQGLNLLKQKLDAILDIPYSITGHKAGIRPAVKDRKPLLGAHPVHKSLLIFNGLGSKGVLYGPFWAAKMSALLCNRENEIPSSFSVSRFWKNR